MLDNNDRQQIIAIIQQTIASSLGSSKQSNKFQGTTYSKYGKASQKDWERQQREKEKKDRIAELEDKRRKGKDSLAQRLELAKLRSEEKLFGNISPEVKDLLKGTAKTAGKVAGGVATGVTAGALGTASAVRNSKLGSSLVSSMMMSNPLTAILYMNSDLISGTARGVGKIGKALGKGALGTAGVLGKGLFSGASWIYSKLRKGSGSDNDDDTTTGTSLIPGQPKRTIRTGKANVMASTNYIMAKNAMLIGGKNYFYISLGGGFTGGLGGAMGSISRGAGAIAGATAGALSGTFTPLLPGPSDDTQPSFAGGGRRMRNVTPKDDTTKSIVKGITGMHEQAKKSNELQKEANKKIAMIAGITLLAVAGIVLLAKYLMDKKDVKPFAPTSQAFNKKVTSGIETSNLDQISNAIIKKQVLGNASLIDNKGSSFTLGDNRKEAEETLKKLQDKNIITEAMRKQIIAGHSGQLKDLQFSLFHTKDNQKTVLSFPVDLFVLSDRVNSDNTRTLTVKKVKTQHGSDKGNLVITKVISKIGYIKAGPSANKDNTVPANTPLCIVADGFTITGPLKDFLNSYDSLQSYINENVKDTKKWSDALDRQRTDDFIKEQVKQSQKEVGTSQARADVTGQSIGDMLEAVGTSSFKKRVEDLKDLPENVGNLLGLAANVEVRPSKNISTLLNGVKRRKTPVIQSSGQGYTGELPDLKTSTINISTPDTIFYSLPIEDTMKANAGLLGIQQ